MNGIAKRLISLLLLVALLLPLTLPAANVLAQEQPPPSRVDELLAAMTPEERVGQLFLVTFPGSGVEAESMAATLVRDLHIGGVTLRASNGNYRNDEITASSLVSLTNGLQNLAMQASEPGGGSGPFVPLFVAVDMVSATPGFADGLPQSGFTRIPSEMALGATWRRENAELVGQIVGQELQAVGINLLLGPALDVPPRSGVSPRPEQQSSLGTRTFGGDPYWVGEMGQAFVQGVRQGGQGRVGTIARHFPGLGSSDRRADEEIATVQKALQALQLEDLPPFFSVTDVTTSTVDGLMTTNLRYRGLQGNIRQITRPISLDATSLPTLINQPELQPWRQAGGILLSDELGALSLRRFYSQQTDPTESGGASFPALIIARDAFNAGNDLLFLSGFAAEDDWDARLENIRRTTQYFAEQYLADPAFAVKVDDSVRRLLALKLRLYGDDFSAAATPLPDPAALDPSPFRAYQNEVARIAQESATLLYPGPAELADRLPGPPLANQNIVIVTDARTVRDCLDCPEQFVLAPDDLENSLLRRYGPDGGSGQLNPDRITSITFEELNSLLADEEEAEPEQESELPLNGEPAAPSLQQRLDNADWLIFLVQDVTPEVPASNALRLFLRNFSGQVRDQKLIVLSFGAPYFLDSTEVSKVTAYYGFYTPTASFVDAAARLLFQEYGALGSSPVTTYPLLDYSLEVQLSPNPSQVVELCLDDPLVPENICEVPTIEDVQTGGDIALRTSMIRDRNGNAVPDGTVVTFLERYPNDNNVQLPHEAQTVNGIARAVIPLNRQGQLDISVISEGANSFTSTTVQVINEGAAPVVNTVIPPTQTSSPTPSATPTQTATPRPTRTSVPASATPTVTPVPTSRWGQPNDGFGWWTFVGTLVGLVAVGGLGGMMAHVGREKVVRRVLLVAVYGLAGYTLFLLLYGFRILPDDFNGWGAIFLALLGGFLALIRDTD